MTLLHDLRSAGIGIRVAAGTIYLSETTGLTDELSGSVREQKPVLILELASERVKTILAAGVPSPTPHPLDYLIQHTDELDALEQHFGADHPTVQPFTVAWIDALSAYELDCDSLAVAA